MALSVGRNSTESDALYRDPMHKAAEPVIIVDRFVPSGAVVPHGEITSPPPHTALKLGLLAMLVEKGEDGNGLLVREAFDVRRKYRVHKQSPTPTEWMFDHNRMACILGRCFGITQPPALGGFAVLDGYTESMARRMHRRHPIEKAAQGV